MNREWLISHFVALGDLDADYCTDYCDGATKPLLSRRTSALAESLRSTPAHDFA